MSQISKEQLEQEQRAERNIAAFLNGGIPAIDFDGIYHGEGDGSVSDEHPIVEAHTIEEVSWLQVERLEDA